MASSLYIVIFALYLLCSVVRNIYLFNKGQYNPYPYRKGIKEFPGIIRLCITFGILIGTIVFITSKKLLYIVTIVFLCYSFCLLVCVSVLNYLYFKNIRDKKIIFQTAVFNIMVISISIIIWRNAIQIAAVK